jgi:fucose permease
VGQAAVLPLLGVAPGWAGFAAAMFCLGVVDSWMDAAMNTHGLRVQRRYGRSILNAFHGVWSIGAVTGGLVGAAAAQAEVPLRWHLLAAGVVLAAISLSCLPMLLPGPEDAERSHLEEPAEQEHAQESAPAQAQQQPAEQPRPAPSRAAPAHPMRRLLVLGALLLVACAVEDTPASWGAVLLRDSYHAPAAVAGLAFVCFQGAMTVGRLLGDRVTDRFGHVAVARAGGLLIALPMAAALPSGVPALVIAAFLLAGLGTATLYPSVMHASGNLPGIRSETGIAVTTWFARVGFLAMPPLVGLLADRVDLRIGVGVMVLLGVLVVLQAGCLTPRADRKAVAKEQAEQIG